MQISAIKIIRGVVTGFLIFVFLIGGVMKLTDQISAKTQEQLVRVGLWLL